MKKLAAVLISAAALAAIPSAANAQSSTAVRINVQHTGMALTSSAVGVVQEPYIGKTSQKWAMISVGSVGGSKVAFRYRNIQTGKCLDIEAPGSGRRLVLLPCVATKLSQHWVRDFSQNVTFLQTINRQSGLAMSVQNAARFSGARVVQEFPNGGGHQKWSVFGI